MKSWKEWLKMTASLLLGIAPDLFAAFGAFCLIYGAALIYIPAGWLMAGALSIAALVVISRGGGDR